MRKFDPNKPLIRVIDEEMSAEDFSKLAKAATVVRCEKCSSVIDRPGLDPKREWVCERCAIEQQYKLATRPRTFYPNNHVPYVKRPRKLELGSVILTGSRQ